MRLLGLARLVFWFAAAAVLVGYGVSFPVLGADEVYRVMPSTPDISVSDSATSQVHLGRGVRWVYIKNDCATDTYFDLRGRPQSAGVYGDGVYPLRLAQDQAFEAPINSTTIGISPGAGSSSCTVTIIPAR